MKDIFGTNGIRYYGYHRALAEFPMWLVVTVSARGPNLTYLLGQLHEGGCQGKLYNHLGH